MENWLLKLGFKKDKARCLHLFLEEDGYEDRDIVQVTVDLDLFLDGCSVDFPYYIISFLIFFFFLSLLLGWLVGTEMTRGFVWVLSAEN